MTKPASLIDCHSAPACAYSKHFTKLSRCSLRHSCICYVMADDLLLQAKNSKHSCLPQQVVTYLCSVQNWSALGCIYIQCYADSLLYRRYEHTSHRNCWFHPAICQTTGDLSNSMFQINWWERVSQCGVRSKASLHHRSCHRFRWQDSTNADHKGSPLPGFGTIASVCAGCTRVWTGQRPCIQLWRYWCNHSSLKPSSSCDWHPVESAKGHFC